MVDNLLASAIGTLCGRHPGLFRLMLPRSLPHGFKSEVSRALEDANGVPILVGEGEGEYSAGEAISFRTPEGGSESLTIVLISTQGLATDLKSLETFRDLLSRGMPGGPSTFEHAVLRLDDVATQVAQQVVRATGKSIDVGRLSEALNYVFHYLADAYTHAGNDEKRWTDAYWQHLNVLAHHLPSVIRALSSGSPGFEHKVVFLSAGLPQPTNTKFYVDKNGPSTYSKVVYAQWSSQENIARSLVEIDQVESGGSGNHPLLSVGWTDYPSTRATLGHPLLSVAYHGAERGDGYSWLHGWASTTERSFFKEWNTDAPEYELCSLARDGESTVLSALGWQGLDHILPPQPTARRVDGRISLGRFQLRLAVDVDTSELPDPVKLEVQPATACTPTVLSIIADDDAVLIEFELSRRVSSKGGRWRERPFTLTVLPSRIVAGSGFRNCLTLKVCVPHPARPTAIGLESRQGSKRTRPTFPTDGKYTIDVDTGAIHFDEGSQEIALLKLRDRTASAELAVVGLRERARWIDGSGLERRAPADSCGAIQRYGLTPLPDNAVVALDGYMLDVQAPQEGKGQVNPIIASILNEPVVSADDDLRNELLSDPRGQLEEWYQQRCISTCPNANLKSCLGTSLLESVGQGAGSLTWNSAIGTYADTSAPMNLQFPHELVDTSEVNAFWSAFEDLELATLGGSQQVSAWPSTLDLRGMPSHRIDRYLSTYCDLLSTIGDRPSHSWLAYPFSALLYDQTVGEAEGILLSPLHPLRLAWMWSVQRVSTEIAESKAFGAVASSFLRFVDGEPFPICGPTLKSSGRWIGTGLAPGPGELFVGWSLLASDSLNRKRADRAIRLMGLELSFGTPSGLDQSSVTTALRDYMRVYPASPQLRLGVATPSGGERYAETDEAIVSASGELIAQFRDSLSGGVRILDASNRRGHPPNPVKVLRKMIASRSDSKDHVAFAPFEWTKEGQHQPASRVDIQFIEDSAVRVRAEEIGAGGESIGTSGPTYPFSRYRSWQHSDLTSEVSSFALGVHESSFGKLPSFKRALTRVENLRAPGCGLKLVAELSLGTVLLGDHARWTITGNRHVDPSVLSSQLSAAPGGIALWEWRPAFLSRKTRKSRVLSIASTHPYTVLARPSSALMEEIASILKASDMSSGLDDVSGIFSSLGIRGVGLSSLLTMGHTQSLGAIGFSVAFRTLQIWEARAETEEVRCIVPIDAIYPLMDVLASGTRIIDDQRRADLLLISAVNRTSREKAWSLHFHPVEVKMRSGDLATFPQPGSTRLDDALHQLSSTYHVLGQLCQNHTREGHGLDLANAAFATLVEAALLLGRPRGTRKMTIETALLAAVAAGEITPSASRGTLLWFQTHSRGIGGSPYEKRSPTSANPGLMLVNPTSLDDPGLLTEIGNAVASTIEAERPEFDLAAVVRRDRNPQKTDRTAERYEPKDRLDSEPEQVHANSEVRERRKVGGERAPDQLDDSAASIPAGITILVGNAPTGASTRPVYFRPSETALNQLNIGVVGDLGTGKTQLLKSFVYQLSRSAASNRGHAPKVFVFDYKRDYSEGDFPKSLGAKILDPSVDPLPINFFALDPDLQDGTPIQLERVRRANFFCSLLKRISGIGQVQYNALYSSVMQAYDACARGHAPSIEDVYSFYCSLGKSDTVVSVLTLMRDLRIFEPNPQNTTTFRALFDRSTVLNLSGLSGAGQEIVDIVATMFLDNLYTDYMKLLPKEPFIPGGDGTIRRKIDSFVLIDEAHHAMGRGFDVLMKLMLEGREFGMGVVLSSQFLSHFNAGGHNWAEALSTWIIHNVRYATLKHFEQTGFRSNISRMVQDIAGLETHWAYYRCVNGYNEGILMEGKPFFSLCRE